MSVDSKKAPGMKQGLTRSNLRTLVLLMAVISAIFLPIHYSHMIVAFVLLAAGSLLHLVTKGTLIRNVVLCDKGIYSAIRHPYYLANYLVDSSFCLLSGNIYLLLAYPFLFFWAYGPSVRQEEALLSSNHPEAFTAYSSTIPQIFPDRASLTEWKTILGLFSRERISLKERIRVARFCALGICIAFIQELKMGNIAVLSDLATHMQKNLDTIAQVSTQIFK
jgi:protein-S-isoprenylcysteine O-methyltransferase Ste14